jgi:hypothetical protein
MVERRSVYDAFCVLEDFRGVGVILGGKLEKPKNHGVRSLGNQKLQSGGRQIVVQRVKDRHP